MTFNDFSTSHFNSLESGASFSVGWQTKRSVIMQVIMLHYCYLCHVFLSNLNYIQYSDCKGIQLSLLFLLFTEHSENDWATSNLVLVWLIIHGIILDCLVPIKNRDTHSPSLHQLPVTSAIGFKVPSSYAKPLMVQDTAVCLEQQGAHQLLLHWKFTTLAEKWGCSICQLQPEAKTRDTTRLSIRKQEVEANLVPDWFKPLNLFVPHTPLFFA